MPHPCRRKSAVAPNPHRYLPSGYRFQCLCSSILQELSGLWSEMHGLCKTSRGGFSWLAPRNVWKKAEDRDVVYYQLRNRWVCVLNKKCVIQTCNSDELCKNFVWRQHSRPGRISSVRAVHPPSRLDGQDQIRPLCLGREFAAGSGGADHHRHTWGNCRAVSVLLSLESQRFSFYWLPMWLRSLF